MNTGFKNQYKVSSEELIQKEKKSIDKKMPNKLASKLIIPEDKENDSAFILDSANDLYNIYNYSKTREVKEYIEMVMSTIMLTQKERFPEHSVNTRYRIKSAKSVRNKFQEILNESSYNEEKKLFLKPIKDIFAAKMIATKDRPFIFYSRDPEIQELIKEKNSKHAILEEMQEFECNLISDPYSFPIKYNYNITKKDYYEKCKKLLQETQKTFYTSSKKLIELYSFKIAEISRIIKLLDISHTGNDFITEEDVSNFDFSDLLQDFNSRTSTKLDLAILEKQFTSLFKNNDLFEKLGISNNTSLNKSKFTETGYVSHFKYIQTPVGLIEFQLQTDKDYTDSRYGLSAHGNLNGKEIPLIEIPSSEEKNIIFLKSVKDITPESYQLTHSKDGEKVKFHKSSTYDNYHRLLTEQPKDSKLMPIIKNYLDKLYSLKNNIFSSNDHEETIVITKKDIYNYVEKDFKNLPSLESFRVSENSDKNNDTR